MFYDINYYRNAVVEVANGTKSMYDALPYPPFAFLLIWWLAGLPILLGNQIWTAATILILVALVLVLTLMAAKVTAQRTNRVWLVNPTSGNIVLLLLTVPMYSQLINGQLSILVISLALIDAVVVDSSACVVAPIAWPHYFTWLPLAALWLIMTGGRQAKFVGFGIIFCYSVLLMPPLVGAVLGVAATRTLVPTLLVAVAVLIGLFGLPHREPPRRHIVPGATSSPMCASVRFRKSAEDEAPTEESEGAVTKTTAPAGGDLDQTTL